MKKFLIILISLFLIFAGFIVYDTYFKEKIPRLKIEESLVIVDKIYIYGTHLNIEGNYNFNSDADLVFYDGKFLEYAINIIDSEDGISRFNLSDLLNDGIYLDEIPVGKYYIFLRTKENTDNNEQNIIWKYYPLKNNTENDETTYYSMSNFNKKMVIKNENSYPTMMLDVSNNTHDNVYDIVINPGHGGRDGGASKNGYKETDFTLDISTEVKEKLEEKGFKVKLTHEKGELDNTEKLEEYGLHGRAVIPREVNAKYLFSIHFNSSTYSSVNGLEIYAAKDINYDLAKLLVKNITSITGLKYSNNKINKVFDGIYSRNFTKDDIEESIQEYNEDGLIPYTITTNSNYYYMIRETGGMITGAYVDNRNAKILANPYVNSNVGTESYILELGYISNKHDLNNVLNNKDKYIQAIINSIDSLYNDNK